MVVIKKLLGSFIVGGFFGLIGQLLLVLIGSALGPGFDPNMIAVLTLIVMGIIGALLFACSLYQKIDKIGGFGAIMPFCGLAAAVSGAVSGIRGSGETLGKSIVKGLKPFLILIAIVTLLSALVGAAAKLV
jgi:hypothetical protein